MNERTTWIVIPAYNESRCLADVLTSLQQFSWPIILVDDGSTDGTAEIASRPGIHVLRHLINLGQGAALQTGIVYALEQNANCIVTFDADGQMDPADISRVSAPILEGEVDIVLGSRFLEKANSIPAGRRLLLRTGTWFTRWSTGLSLTDTHNGFRAFNRQAASSLNIQINGMAHASEIIETIARLRLRFMEVPVSIRYTPYSLGKGQTSWNSFNILWELFFK